MSKQPVPASLTAIDLNVTNEEQRDAPSGPPPRAGRVALTLRIEPELHRDLRSTAFNEDTTIQELILRALQDAGYRSARPDRR
jgi:predicted HicB family RNase H-like nuclease